MLVVRLTGETDLVSSDWVAVVVTLVVVLRSAVLLTPGSVVVLITIHFQLQLHSLWQGKTKTK